MITWQLLPFSQLTTSQLYALLRLRVDIFVVEQQCPYPELDGKDNHPQTHHLLGYQNDQIVAYARLLPPKVNYTGASIGRVTVSASARGTGLGHQLIEKALICCNNLWPDIPVEIGAQAHLENFYQRHGFSRTSSVYVEDGIPHIDMKSSLTKKRSTDY
jgi:ElaA protein